MGKLTKRQIERRREWLDHVFHDACGRADKEDVIAACNILSTLHPGQWDTHPCYSAVKSHVVDCNPQNR